jgi:fibronectin type 3 domain-containing protein
MVALILAVICHILLIKDTKRRAWTRVLSGAAALVVILLCVEWIAVTSGTGADAWSALRKHHHSVTLHWTASTSPNVIGYNIYRGTKQGKHEKKLTVVPVGALSFTDTDVKSGKTYYYVARAVNGAGKESTDSNETSAMVP